MSMDKASVNLIPPASVAANAQLGLELREKFKRGGTDVGVSRAQGLAARRSITFEDAAHIGSYFARHTVDKQAKSHDWGDVTNPSAGFIAWLLWGGDEGEKWVKTIKADLDKA